MPQAMSRDRVCLVVAFLNALLALAIVMQMAYDVWFRASVKGHSPFA
jgi:hypothetical protein